MIFKRNNSNKRDLAIGLDLGVSQLKAAVLVRKEQGVQLAEYAVMPTAIPVGKQGGEQELATELTQLLGKLKIQDRKAFIAISSGSAVVCETEFPRMPINEVRNALKLNSQKYLRRDLTDYYMDAVELSEPETDGKAKKSSSMRVLVGGATKNDVRWYRDALVAAKIRPETMELSAVSVVNAFQVGQRETCEKENVLLIDVGAASTNINFLRLGQPLMTRIMHFGGQQISEYISQILTLDPKAAEEEKVQLTEAVQPLVKTALMPLAREVRSSVDFFERQQECHVSKAFACGGSACAPLMMNFLSELVGLHIEPWNPVHSFDTSHFNGETVKLMECAPGLAAAIGVAAVRI